MKELIGEIKNAPPPIIVDNLSSKKERIRPSAKYFKIIAAPLALEIQEGFGAMETQFKDYRMESKDYRAEFKDFRIELTITSNP